MEQEQWPLSTCATTAKELKVRRYKAGFFDVIFLLFPVLDIVAGAHNLILSQLLRLLLENIYDEGKIDQFICEIRAFEAKGTCRSITDALIAPTIKEYVRKHNLSQEIHNNAMDLVDFLSQMDVFIAFAFNPIWEQSIFYIEGQSTIKFYNDKEIRGKLVGFMVESNTKLLDIKDRYLREFLSHKFSLSGMYNEKQKQEIEMILTEFYQIYCKLKS